MYYFHVIVISGNVHDIKDQTGTDPNGSKLCTDMNDVAYCIVNRLTECPNMSKIRISVVY